MFAPLPSLDLKKTLIAGSAAMALLFPGLACAQSDAPRSSGAYAEPGKGAALWVVRDEDSTLYLFGTFHALRPDVAWRTETVLGAFHAADDYWFEVADMNDVSKVLPIIQEKGLSPERPLSSLLTEDELASLDAAARTVGVTAQHLNPMRPWFASLSLAIATLTAAGYKAENGGDYVLHAMARQTGKPIHGFESMDQQVGFLANMDEASQLAALRSSLAEFKKGTEQLDLMVQAWAEGDVESLDTLASATVREEAPVMYEVIYTQRNQNWAEQIEGLLEGAGTHFIAIGAGHLAGPDSLQVQLQKRGIRAERINP